jgi:hypothetical protein
VAQERLGQGQGVGAERVAGLEDPGDPRMLLEHSARTVGEDLELLGPGQGVAEVDVHLGQDAVEQQVVELLLVADVAVEGAGDDPQARGQAAHGEGLDALVGDDRQGLGDHALAGELGTAVLVDGGRVEPQRGCLPVGRRRAGRRRCSGGGSGPLPLLHARSSVNADLDR